MVQRRLAPVTALLVLVLALMPILASAQDGGGRPSAPVIIEPGVRGPSIVLTDAGTDPAVVAADNGIATGFVYRSAVNGFSADLTDAAVASLQQDANVESISIDRIVSIDAVPNQLRRVGADTSATSGAGTGASHPEVGIAIIDSGVGPNADLNIVNGVDCTNSGTYNDANGHGTHVAGIAGARDNGDATTGIAPGASIYAVRVLVGSTGSLSAVICGLNWIATNSGGIDVVNMSLGLSQGPGPACGTAGVFPLRQAVCGVTSQGIEVVAAAGNNSGQNTDSYSPASYPEVTSVSAYTDTNGRTGGGGAACNGGDDQFATYSNVNADVMAPGSCITSTAPGGGTALKSGTSMAAPLVAGAIGLYGSSSGLFIPRTDPKGGVTSGDGLVLYIGNGTIPGGGGTATPTVTPRPATATPTTGPATATPQATATRRPRATSTPGGGGATATPRPATATSRPATATTRPGTATATTRPVTATPRPGTATATGIATARPTRRPRTGVTSQEEVTATPTLFASATVATTQASTAAPIAPATRRPRTAVQSTATSIPTSATATIAPTQEPTTEPTEIPTEVVTEEPTIAPTETPTEAATEEPTIAPTEIPTELPTEVPTEFPTEIPTEEPTLLPTEVPTEIPTEEPTLIPTEQPTIVPAVVSDTFFQGTAWYAADGDPLTTWYLEVPAPVLTEDVPVAPVDETGEVPVDGIDGTGEIQPDVPVEVVVEPTAEPEDLALEIDLGYIQTVGGVRWQWTETTYAHGAEVQVSLDGETWTTVGYPDTYGAIPGEWQEIPLGIDTQYVRFLFPNAGQLPIVGGLSEVEVLPVPAV